MDAGVKYSVAETLVSLQNGQMARSTAPTKAITTGQVTRLENSDKAMKKSCSYGTPVRVLRKPFRDDDSLMAGVRYDGLYKVTRVWKKAETDGCEKVWAHWRD